MAFSVTHGDSSTRARTGLLALNHGTVSTPCFMPVGTNATVKAIKNRDLEAMGVNLILGNTYHLYLRPGRDVIREAGGLHSFMGWRHNILTDSGGYQVFSLASFRKVEDDGVFFRSHLDGSSHRLTPEDVLDIQMILGSDVMMPLDECTSPGISREDAEMATRRTTSWLERTAREWKSRQAPMKGELFGIMQGNFFKDLRRQSASEMAALDLPGYAIGGLSVGEEFPVFRDLLHYSAALLPDNKPKYLMGIGTPQYILEAVEAGIDLFDCVFPTRTARNAQVFSSEGPLSLRNEKYKNDFRPIDEECGCETCRNHTRAYLRHLFKAREIQAAVLATCHNLAWLTAFVQSLRIAVSRGEFVRFKAHWLDRLGVARETEKAGEGAEQMIREGGP
jgi:queuine tRNA-ribosyltransferase